MKGMLLRIWNFIDRFLNWINKPEVLLFPFVLFAIASLLGMVVAPERFSEVVKAFHTIPSLLWAVMGILVLGLVVEASLNRMEREGMPQRILWKIYARYKLALWITLLLAIVRSA